MTSCLSKHFLVWKGCLCALHHMMTKTFLNIHLEKYPQEKVVVRSIATKTIYQQTQEQTAKSVNLFQHGTNKHSTQHTV